MQKMGKQAANPASTHMLPYDQEILQQRQLLRQLQQQRLLEQQAQQELEEQELAIRKFLQEAMLADNHELPIAFINALINLLSTLSSGFDEYLSKISVRHTHVTHGTSATDMVMRDELFEVVWECVGKLYEEEREEYDGLERDFPIIDALRRMENPRASG
jgi:hypothetical protein